MPPGCPLSRRLRAWVVRLVYSLLLTPVMTGGYAQPVSSAILIDSVPAGGLQLKQGWRFHAGDLPNGADPRLDDRQWAPIDPVRDIRELPQVTQAGIGWLRLRLTISPNLPPLQTFLFTTVASEVYFDGRLLYQFGTLSATPDSVRAYNPYAAYPVPFQPGTEHLLALRIACQPGIDYQKAYLGLLPSPVRVTLYPATAIPAVHPYNVASVYVDSAKISMATILFILHLGLFLAYRRQRANLVVALMYLLLVLTHILRAGVDLVHTVADREILYHGHTLHPFVSGLMFLSFYELFGFRKNGWFWLIMTAVALEHIHFPAEYRFLNAIGGDYQSFELLRIIGVSTWLRLLGARVVAVGIVGHMVLSLFVASLMRNKVPVIGNEWLYESAHGFMFLCIPLALSLRLALENGWVNRQLGLKLTEVEDLSARNVAQQQERQALLARQNEELEQQVAERTDELRRQADRLHELNRTRSRFVTNLTHEFRTPLSLIISPVEKLLESPELPPIVQAPLRTVDRNARHLLNQVNQLLDITRLEDGHVRVVRQPVRLDQLTAQLVELFESPARAAQIALTFTTKGDDGACLMDTDKWGKIVYNLLANALKFTPVGGQVAVQLHQETAQVRFVVSDTGIGIAPDKLSLIFDRFYQVEDHLTRPFEGSGVGLALVRELTDLMGGSVTVTSEPSAGSTFTLTLPRQPVLPDSETGIETPHRPAAVRPMPAIQPESDPLPTNTEDGRALMLVVEDNAELRAFMVDELSGRYRVLTAANGEAGWEAIQQHLPDVVISDVMMPRMDGLKLTDLIKSTPATDHIAVVLLTARSTHESRLEGLQQGADEYLVKPFDLAELRLRLANIVARQQTLRSYYRQQIEQPGGGGEPSTDSPPPTDPFLARIYGLLERHLDDPQVGVEWLADQLAMDRKTLYRKLQSKFRLSPNALIRTYRLRRAGEFLRAGRTMTDVAYSVGFDSVTYFGKCFKEQYQMTPSEFTAVVTPAGDPAV